MKEFEIEIVNHPRTFQWIAEVYHEKQKLAEVSYINGDYGIVFHSLKYNALPFDVTLDLLTQAKEKLALHIKRLQSLANLKAVVKEGQKPLETILMQDIIQIFPNRLGGKDVFTTENKGKRYDKEENLVGFLVTKKIKENKFELTLVSDIHYKKILVEIYHEGTFIGLVTSDQGFEEAVLEIQSSPNLHKYPLKLHDFIKIIQEAVESLKD